MKFLSICSKINTDGEWEGDTIKILQLKICDKLFPETLKKIYNPPKALYCFGNIKLLNTNIIAIIGARECSTYGKQVTKKIAKELVENNYTVVSGLAVGIDSYAHIGGIERTIAVLGSGFNNIYPHSNIELVKNIIKNNGLVVSEYELNEKPKPQNFPARNRIISGLSNGIIVVEAKKKSGTFITVDLGLEAGKNIYAVPRKYKQYIFRRN